jgi:hypothetical protein
MCASLRLFTDNGRDIVFATDKVPVINGSNSCELVSIPQGVDGPMGPTGPTGPPGDWSNAQTIVDHTTSYTVVAGDVGKMLTMTSESALNLTIPSGLGWTTGQRVDAVQNGGGQVTCVASGTTLHSTPSLLTRAQYSAISIIYMGSETYLIVGDLA